MSKDDLSILLTVNGADYSLPMGITLPELLVKLGFKEKLVAIEYNGEILHRQFWGNTVLQAGDNLEVVTIVGGG